jgi:DNA-binding SARP family transcriptional activator
MQLVSDVPPQVPISIRPPRPQLSLRLLGGFDLRVDGSAVSLPSSAQRLVALLALRGRCGRSRLAGALWPDTTESRAMGCLRTAIWRVNQVAPGLVTSSPGAAALDADADVDVRHLIDSSQALLAGHGAPGERTVAPQDGDLLPDWEDEWLEADRERLRQLRLHVLEAQAERLLNESAFGLALEWALAAVRAEPLRESAHRAVIRIHLAEGNLTEARRSYSQCVELFARELGVHPTGITAALLS